MSLITVQSPKGGVGVSMVAASLANVARHRGLRIALVECGGGDAARFWLGIAPIRGEESSDADTGHLISEEGVVLRTLETSQTEDVSKVVNGLQSEGYIVIVDRPFTTEDPVDSLPKPDLNVWVMTPEAPSLAKLAAVTRGWGRAAHDLMVVNRTDERRPFHRDAVSFLKETIGSDSVFCIRADEAVNESFASIEPLSIYAASSAALADIETLASAAFALLAAETAARDEAQV